MSRLFALLLVIGSIITSMPATAQPAGGFTLIKQELPDPDNEPRPVFPVPTERQLRWNETEFYAFFHYGMNTYTDKEWGYGNESESTFAPTAAPNPYQWLRAVKAAGMRGGIAVVKHHDGFCLWPTATTTHNITRSGNAYGRATDIPRDFARAARSLGMKYGFYVSPWDRNSAYYGTDRYVSEVFLRQCAELARYGADQFEMWFDGANGGDGYYGGTGGKRSIDASTYYDIPNLRDSVHKVSPECVMWGLGGEARWIGTEAGYGEETCWSPSPRDGRFTGDMNSWLWCAAESDAKLTDKGWFWHEGEQPMSAERTFQMYLETVGRNATLILNCPPDRRGLLPDLTVKRLKETGQMLRKRLGHDLAPKARVTVSQTRAAGKHRNYEATNLTDGNPDTYWATADSVTTATITLTWPKVQTLRYVTLMEYIRKGQRIKAFRIETSEDGVHFTPRATNVTMTTVGYKRIIPLNGSTADSYGEGFRARALRITILDSRACPLLHSVSVF